MKKRKRRKIDRFINWSLTFLKNMSYWTLIIVLSNALIDKMSGKYTGIVYITQIVFGFIFALSYKLFISFK